jgi:hypothetical protein
MNGTILPHEQKYAHQEGIFLILALSFLIQTIEHLFNRLYYTLRIIIMQ